MDFQYSSSCYTLQTMDGIILIGPICAGKSTLAALLEKGLHLPRIEVDELRWQYFNDIGYSENEARRIFQSQGNLGVLRYSKPFEAQMVEKVLAEHPKKIIDMGAGHSVYDRPEDFERVSKALSPYKHVILVLPSPDAGRSIAVLNKRFAKLLRSENIESTPEMMQLNEDFVRNPSNAKLAKRTIYTEGKSPQECCAEIIDWIERSGN